MTVSVSQKGLGQVTERSIDAHMARLGRLVSLRALVAFVALVVLIAFVALAALVAFFARAAAVACAEAVACVYPYILYFKSFNF